MYWWGKSFYDWCWKCIGITVADLCLEKRKCTVNEQDTTALIFSQKHLEALYLQCLMHRRNAMQEIPELKGLSETCNRIYKLQDVDVLFQCLLMDQMDWEEEKLYVQFSTIYLLKQTVKN